MVFVNLPSRRRRTHKPWAALLLAALLVLGYLWLLRSAADPGRHAALLDWASLSANPIEWRSLWHDRRLASWFTALFFHANFGLLLGNVLFLLIFGVPGERALGAWRLLALFFLGGASANLLASLLLDSPPHLVLGASGAVSALVGAYLVLFPRARLGVVVPLGLWLEYIRAPALLMIALWAALQLLFAFVGPAFGVVALWANLTGFAVGVLLALWFRPGMTRR